jgi:hypothetical protein
MSLALLNIVEVIEIMENYVESIRPPESIRDRLDITYKIEDQSVILQEVRPVFKRPGEIGEYGYAKATFVKRSNKWKVYWKRASGKWDPYPPTPEVNDLKEFIELVEEDRHHCFKG